MAGKLEGKIAVVTASTEGIGLAIAKRLGEDGASVVVSSRKKAKVEKAVQLLKSEDIEVTGCVCHVGKAEDRKKLLETTAEKYGGIDILVSNAGTNLVNTEILETHDAIWDKMFDTNLKSHFQLIREAFSYLSERKSSNIVLVSSLAGLQPSRHLAVYSVTKTALIGLCKALAPQLADNGIRINCIAPGTVRTKFSQPLLKSEASRQMILDNIPLKRIGSSEDCAALTAFLASDDASYITGETVVLAGGVASRL